MRGASSLGWMEKHDKPRKMIWAVDAFDNPERLRSQAPLAVTALAKHQSVEVVPVYVLSPGQINLSIEFSGPYIHQYRPAAEHALESALRDVKISGVSKSEVIVEDYTSTTQAAKTLADYAYAQGADLILVTSHGWGGIRRLFIGSFAESLLYHSRVPVLILGPRVQVPGEFKTVLVPTQFGARSKAVFKRIVEYVKGLEAKIVLFHTIPHPVEPLLQSGAYLMGGSWVPVQSYFSEETERHERRAQAWARWARHQGVDVEVIVDTYGGSIGDSILYLARTREASVIAMESRSGPVAAALIGSVTRYVIHHAELPVWVLRSRPWPRARSIDRDRRFRRAA